MASPSTKSPTKNNKLIYIEGDLFSCPKDECMAHCVSEDLKMGAGIAVLFKKNFGQVDELKRQNVIIGKCAILKLENRFIYYLVTKAKFYQKPTYATLQSSLEAMLDHCLKNGVQKVSMPQIGAGLDKLDWKRVKNIIEKVFDSTGIQVTIYIFKKK
jgi:Predicted phosphatase homologous to the C-terminal domain of histone macroH2A1